MFTSGFGAQVRDGVLQFGKLSFDDLRCADRGVGIESKSLGMTDKERKCLLGPSVHLMIQRHKNLMHLVDLFAQGRHFDW